MSAAPARTTWSWTGERAERPWGYYLVLIEDLGFKVKQFVVRPGKRLSLQRHRKRSEHWFVVRGKALVTRNEETLRRAAGESVDIPLGAVHRVESLGPDELVIVEIQRGDYVGEDDIERLADDFGRA